jgi:type IV secretory pathway VirB4 component
MFRTARGSPFAFCYHENEQKLSAGHTLLIGGTGAGKSVLMNFLTTSALGYSNLHAFKLDRYDGAYVPTVALGGRYLHMQAPESGVGETFALNPFRMDPDPQGTIVTWLTAWVRDYLAGVHGQEPIALEEISRAVRDTMALPSKDQRSLDTVYRGLTPDSPHANAIKRFVSGQYSTIFTEGEDTLSLTRMVTFNFTRVLDDPVMAGPLVAYITFRIETLMDRQGSPWILEVDEAAALLRNSDFRREFEKWMQEMRKMRGVLIAAFQRVGTLQETGTAELLLSQCPNLFVFPNEEADREDYTGQLGLTPGEFAIVKGDDPSVAGLEHYVLLKRRGMGSVVLDIDLTDALGDHLKIFESAPEPANQVRALQAALGDRWLEHWLGTDGPAQVAAE